MGEFSFFSYTTRPTNVEAINEVELYALQIENLIPYFNQNMTLMEILFKLLIRNLNHVSNPLHHLYFFRLISKSSLFFN